MDHEINSSCHGNYVVYYINVTKKRHLKEKTEPVGNLKHIDKKIGMLPCA